MKLRRLALSPEFVGSLFLPEGEPKIAQDKRSAVLGSEPNESSRPVRDGVKPAQDALFNEINHLQRGRKVVSFQGTTSAVPQMPQNNSCDLQIAEKLNRAVGRGFIPGTKPFESNGVLTPEVRFSRISDKTSSFSAASLAPAKCSVDRSQHRTRDRIERCSVVMHRDCNGRPADIDGIGCEAICGRRKVQRHGAIAQRANFLVLALAFY